MVRLPVREDLSGQVPYGAPQLDVPILLNVNENPYPPSDELVAEIVSRVADAARSLNRYPERDFSELRSELVAYLAEESGVTLDPGNIWAANGSNEVMLHLMLAFGGPGRTALSFAPTYSMYPDYARDTFTTWMTGERNSDYSLNLEVVARELEVHKPSILFLCSPNNPTGTALSLDEIQAILDLARTSGPESDDGPTASVVVVDEAYGEFRRAGVPSALELLADNQHLVVSRTMSKAFGAAGLRLGYMAAAREIIDQIMLVRLPYHLSAITQAAALAALAHRDQLADQIDHLRTSRDQLVTDLQALGLETTPSDANFIMFGTFDDTRAVWQGLLDRGILIREVGPAGCLRVSIGTDEENAAFLAALKEVLEL